MAKGTGDTRRSIPSGSDNKMFALSASRRVQQRTVDKGQSGENATASHPHPERSDGRTVGLGRMSVRPQRLAAPAEITHPDAAIRLRGQPHGAEERRGSASGPGHARNRSKWGRRSGAQRLGRRRRHQRLERGRGSAHGLDESGGVHAANAEPVGQQSELDLAVVAREQYLLAE